MPVVKCSLKKCENNSQEFCIAEVISLSFFGGSPCENYKKVENKQKEK